MPIKKRKISLVVNQGKVGIIGYSKLGQESTFISCSNLPNNCLGHTSASSSRYNEFKIKCNKLDCPFKLIKPEKCIYCEFKSFDLIENNKKLKWICIHCKNII